MVSEAYPDCLLLIQRLGPQHHVLDSPQANAPGEKPDEAKIGDQSYAQKCGAEACYRIGHHVVAGRGNREACAYYPPLHGGDAGFDWR